MMVRWRRRCECWWQQYADSRHNHHTDDTSNDFVGPVSASGTAVTLIDDNAIVLGDVDATLSVTGYAITDDGIAAAQDPMSMSRVRPS